jgi:hypothetical protein
MNFADAVATTSPAVLAEKAQRIASANKLIWNVGVKTILKAVSRNPSLAPNVRGDTEEIVIRKWLDQYSDAVRSAISLRVGNPPGTIPDPIIETIISARLPNLSGAALKQITYGHRLAMSAENILGLLLEEYLAIQLAPAKWHCCWGETLRSVDFVNEDGRLLQVKNRSNSENSSSSRVRLGTNIEKWFRVHAIRGHYLWEDLQAVNRNQNLTEDKFREFVVKTLKANPHALTIESSNPWGR